MTCAYVPTRKRLKMEIPRGKSETTGAPRSAIRRDEASTGALTYGFTIFGAPYAELRTPLHVV